MQSTERHATPQFTTCFSNSLQFCSGRKGEAGCQVSSLFQSCINDRGESFHELLAHHVLACQQSKEQHFTIASTKSCESNTLSDSSKADFRAACNHSAHKVLCGSQHLPVSVRPSAVYTGCCRSDSTAALLLQTF